MKYTRVVVARHGGSDVLRLVEEELPVPGDDEVRVRVLAAGVALPDVLAREGVHPETPRVPFTPGWDLVGEVDCVGASVSAIEPGQVVAAMPIHGAYAEFICLKPDALVPVPPGVDPAAVVSLILNYVTAYQMLHRCAKVAAGQKALVHGAAGGVGSALLQLGRLSKLELYGTCSSSGAATVSNLGAVPIDYQQKDFVQEVRRLAGGGVDVVFDPIGGKHLWESRGALRRGGRVVGYGLSSSLRGKGLTASRPGRRERFRGICWFALCILGGWILPGRTRVIPYSIQTLKRLKPDLFRQDLSTLLGLLHQGQIEPIVAQRLPLSRASHAQELLEKGGVAGKIVLVCAKASRPAG